VDIEGELSEAEGYVKAMEIYCETIKTDKKSLLAKVRDYKDEYKHLVQQYRQSKSDAESLALKGGSAARSKLITANEKLDKSTVILEQSRNVIHQTEQVGVTIITDLDHDKEKLLYAKDKVKDTKQVTYDAKYILQQMGYRAVIQKILIFATIVILFIVIVLIFYYGIIAKKN
jgi:vesicle transport through interaction with t-SNAREs protein 1